MKGERLMSVKIKIVCLSFTCLLFLAAGCVETAMKFHGNPVTSVPVVALLEGGPHAGIWKTFDLVIDYTYKQNGGVLDISGQCALSEHYRMSYANISRIFVYLFFLDEDSRVLETLSFPNNWLGGTDEVQLFSQSHKIPAGTTTISFGYSGEVNERDDRMSFYELPIKE
jgi:hypothetical protein